VYIGCYLYIQYIKGKSCLFGGVRLKNSRGYKSESNAIMFIITAWHPGWPLSIWLFKKFTGSKNDIFLFLLYCSKMGRGMVKCMESRSF
jgi:hypothetical protein